MSSVNENMKYCPHILGDKIYALGGYNGQNRMSSAERYSPCHNQWEIIPSMHRERSDASAAALNGKVSTHTSMEEVWLSHNISDLYLGITQCESWLENQAKSFFAVPSFTLDEC